MHYIYIDESGDLGGIKALIMLFLLELKWNNPRILERLITKTGWTYKKEIGKSNKIEDTTTPPEIKKKNILKRLNKVDCEIFIIIFNMRNKIQNRF